MKIGKINIESPLILAPMEDVADTSFRLICKRLGADLFYTEFTSSEALIRDIPKAMRKIDLLPEERPIAIQLFGSSPESMEEAVKVSEKFKPDFIDINCGCWVKKHINRCEGAGLLRDLPRMEAVIKAAVKATKIPVTVKTRLGWDKDSIVIMDVAKMVEQAGAKALALHCRTRSQAHREHADWSWLSKVKKQIKIPLIGNGDVTTAQDVKAMFETGCDGVMIGRGAVNNPWIFKQAKHYLKTGKLLPLASLEEKVNLCVDHIHLVLKYRTEWDAVMGIRKYYVGYFKGVPKVSKLRTDLMQLKSIDAIVARLKRFLEET